jgi:AhpD family alkylhydroperoxidase
LEDFSHAVSADGALARKNNQLIAASVAHVTQCPLLHQRHNRLVRREGPPEEIIEAI